MSKPLTKAQQKAAEVLANRRAAFEKKVRALLGHVGGKVSKAELDAAFAKADQYSYSEVAEAFAAEVAAREPVGRAVHAQKAEAVRYAEQKAREIVARVEKELAEAGWDRQAYAPYPMNLRSGTLEHDRARAKHNLVSGLTMSDPAKGYQINSRRGEPHFVVMDPDGVERFVENTMRDAAIQYDAFICKMVGKVGEGVTDAQLEGNHVWSYSHLTVRKGEAAEVWKTQQIVNYTKYGRPYLQWPSRKLK